MVFESAEELFAISQNLAERVLLFELHLAAELAYGKPRPPFRTVREMEDGRTAKKRANSQLAHRVYTESAIQ